MTELEEIRQEIRGAVAWISEVNEELWQAQDHLASLRRREQHVLKAAADNYMRRKGHRHGLGGTDDD